MAQASNLPDSERLFFESVQFSKSAPKARHGFFGRNGGVSKGVYASLNCGRGSDDNPANVRDNLSLVAREIGVLEGDIVTLYQVHGDTCLYIDAPMSLEDRPQADAMITDQSGLALGVLTADCAPVLFYGQKADGTPLIGAAHAGWKGALGGVLDTTVKAMCDKGA
ncbi:MAG: polyphenol oxidase family protein, partial [Alphaproteobacteria bacterium]